MKKIIYTLILILAANYLLSSLVLQFGFPMYSKSYFCARSLQKALILAASVYLVLRSKNRPYLFAHSIWSIPLSLTLLALAYYQVDATAGANKQYISVGLNLSFLLSCLLVGFFEELLFRVYVFSELWAQFDPSDTKKKKPLIKSILITSILFGLGHATNIFRSGYTMEGVLNQIIVAAIIGVFFQALFVRFNNIILIGVLHGITNYLGSFKTKLLAINLEPEPFVMQEFLLGIGILLALFFILVAPISLWLIRPKIN